RGTRVPRRRCADADGRSAAGHGRSRRFETTQEIRDAARSGIPLRTSREIGSYLSQACAAPSTYPSLRTPPCPRLAGRLAGCSRRKYRRAPSSPIRGNGQSTRAPGLKPAATPYLTKHAEKEATGVCAPPYPSAFLAWSRSRANRDVASLRGADDPHADA